MEPRVLLVETSGRIGLVGVGQGERLLAARRLDEARRHARDLAPAVAELLAEQNWRPIDITAVIVSRGPGSYTGLRVGIMSAKTLAYATGCALLAIETFAIIANQAADEAERIDVLADAQQDKLYVQSFNRKQALADLIIEPADDWLARRDADAWVSGPGLPLVANRLPPACRRIEPPLSEPGLASLLHLGMKRLQQGERDDFWTLEPLYARLSSAEEKWGKP